MRPRFSTPGSICNWPIGGQRRGSTDWKHTPCKDLIYLIYASDINNSHWYTLGSPKANSSSSIKNKSEPVTYSPSTFIRSPNELNHFKSSHSLEKIARHTTVWRKQMKRQKDDLFHQIIKPRVERRRAGESLDRGASKAAQSLPESAELGRQDLPVMPRVSGPDLALQGVDSKAPEQRSSIITQFEIHTRCYPGCHNPYEIHCSGRRLCDSGHKLAQDVPTFSYVNRFRHVFCTEITGLELEKFCIPSYYVQVRSLLTATEMFLKGRRQKRQMNRDSTDSLLLPMPQTVFLPAGMFAASTDSQNTTLVLGRARADEPPLFLQRTLFYQFAEVRILLLSLGDDRGMLCSTYPPYMTTVSIKCFWQVPSLKIPSYVYYLSTRRAFTILQSVGGVPD